VKIPNNPPQWINDDYLLLRKDLERAKVCAQNSSSEAAWDTFKLLRNKTNNLASRLKREFFESSIREAGSNSYKLWKTVKTVLPTSNKIAIRSVRDGDTIVNDGKLIADVFNTFFSNIGQNLADAFLSNKTSDEYHGTDETTPCESPFQFSKISEDDVADLLKGMDGKKATGLDNISPKLLKIGFAQLCRPLTYIMNLRWITRDFVCKVFFRLPLQMS
jgi:hypothetical protein